MIPPVLSKRVLRALLVMMSVMVGGANLLTAPASLALQRSSPARATTTVPSQRTFLDQYCVTCHNQTSKTAGLTLENIDIERVGENALVWEKVARKLRTRAMPPAGMPRPDSGGFDSLATYLETALDRAAVAEPEPGSAVVRRLNRTEYSNVVRDFLGIDTDAIDVESLLPPDESAHGFDNIGAVLSISPLLMERYLLAARKVARIAVGDPAVRPVFETYSLPKFLMQDQYHMSEDLPFGSRGGIAIRHHFPVDGDYVAQIRLQRMTRESIRGILDEPHEIEVRLDGERIELFKVGGENKGPFEYFGAGRSGDPAQEQYERTADEGLEVRFSTTAGTHLVGVTFPSTVTLPEGMLGRLRPPLTVIEFSQFKGGVPGVGDVTISGPYDTKGVGDTPSRSKIFVCNPENSLDDVACARTIVSALSRRAYRRPVNDQDISILLEFYAEGQSKGGFEAGIQAAIERILLDPEFLFRVERDPPNAVADTAYPVSDLELASRMSFFLWSSIPDDELLELAALGRLRDPVVLEQQVRRMLGDPRSAALVTNFAGQWLLLRNLRSISPDPEVYPYFDDNLRVAFQRETELFFESLMRDDRSVMDLLNADYTFVNERLAEHYGIPDVYGNRFRRVTVTDEDRRGLLGQGSILTLTSYATRTAPTLRGKWILENILGAPPPPPPPDAVADLKENARGAKVLTVRERLEEHRVNPACASCHAMMDPAGFALENFDGIGRWRETEGGSTIDASGVLPDGEKFQGPAELRQVLLAKRQQFVVAFTEKLLTYALGRGLEHYDAPTVRKIIRETTPEDYRWSSIILSMIRSAPFQMRRTQPS